MIDLQALVTAKESADDAVQNAALAAANAALAAKTAELAKVSTALDHMGMQGDSSWGYDWVGVPVRTLDLTGYTEVWRDDFDDPNTVMVDNGTTGGKWYSPARQNFIGAGISGSFNKSQVTVANSECRLRIERATPPSQTSDWGTWKTAHLQTKSSTGVGFSIPPMGCYFEARIKLPQQLDPYGWVAKTGAPMNPQRPADTHGARASWTAFWLLSDNEYASSDNGQYGIENDFFEFYGGDANLHSTIHLKPHRVVTPRAATDRQTNGNLKSLNYVQFDGNYHTYGGLYEDDYFTVFFDGKAQQRFEMNRFLNTPMYLNLTNVLGPDVSFMWSAQPVMDMFVDYVRVLKKV